MKVEEVDPVELVHAEYNPRAMTRRQMEALKGSIDRWGFVEPVVVNKKSGNIVGGHQRTKAAVELSLEKVPVTFVDLDEEQEKALNVALNKIGGSWDALVLQTLLDELESSGWDLGDLGFSDEDVEDALDSWNDPADLSDVTEYDPEQETVVVKIEVPFVQSGDVAAALNAALDAAGWDYRLENAG